MPEGQNPYADRTLIALGVAVVVAALIAPASAPAAAGVTPATANPPAAVEVTSAASTATAVAAEGAQPTLVEVPLSDIDQAVADSSPDPQDHDHGTVGALSVDDELTLAVADRVRTDQPATLVAVTADEAFEPGTSIQVRVEEREHGWSDWTTLQVDPEHGPDPESDEAASARPGSEPLTTTDAINIKVRIDTPSGAVPTGTELALVAAPTVAADSPAGRVSALGAVGRPSIVTRAQWGADESWRGREPYYTDDIRAGFIHHTASTSNYTPAQAAAQVRSIYAYHTRSLGHSDIDYNFLVDRFGQLYEGRYGGMDQPVLGAHTAGFNEHTFAAVALGNFDSTSPSASQMSALKDSLARLFAWKLGLSGVDPTATVNLVSAGFPRPTRYPKGSVATLPAISSHQMVNYTACPGRYLQAQLPAIRALAAGFSNVAISAPSTTTPTFRAGTRSRVKLTARTTGAISWTADVISPCSDTPIRSYSGRTSGAGTITVKWDLKDSRGAAALPATYTVRMSGKEPNGTPVTGATSTVTITPTRYGAWGPCANTSRVAGDNPSQTSVLWGRITAPDSRTVVLTGTPDAGRAALGASVAAGPLAKVLRAPLLVTRAGALDPDVAADIRAREATEVIIVGKGVVVSAAVATSLEGLGARVTRLAGSTRAKTAARVAERMGSRTSAVLVSPDDSQAHSLTGSALAAARGVPVLIASDTLPAATAGALAGRRSVTVVAPPGSAPESVIRAKVPGISVKRLWGVDEVRVSVAVAGAFPSTISAMLMPENRGATWATASVAASAGMPLLFTASSAISPEIEKLIGSRASLRATTTSVPGAQLDDQVLGGSSRALPGRPWSPPTAVPTPTSTSTRASTRTNASPEPVQKGSLLKVRAAVTAKYTDGSWRPIPAGVPFSVKFKPYKRKPGTFKVIATGTTTTGLAKAYVTAKRSGRFRIVIGTTTSRRDFVRVIK